MDSKRGTWEKHRCNTSGLRESGQLADTVGHFPQLLARCSTSSVLTVFYDVLYSIMFLNSGKFLHFHVFLQTFFPRLYERVCILLNLPLEFVVFRRVSPLPF